jgi:hypothetical protein
MKSKIFQWSMILLSLNGLFFVRFEEIFFTVFYAWTPILFLIFIFGSCKNRQIINKEQKKLLGIFIFPILSILFNEGNVFTNAVLHLIFYLLIAFILLSWMDYRKEILIKVSKIIIVLYFVNVAISMLLTITGIGYFLPEIIFKDASNTSNPFGMSLFRIAVSDGHFRYCGFSLEPSYLAVIITASILSIIYFHTAISRKQLWRYVLLYSITILISKTSYGFLYMALVYLYMFQIGLLIPLKTGKAVIGALFLPIAFIIIYIIFQDNLYLMRLKDVASAILNSSSNDIATQIQSADFSGFVRIGPAILFLQDLNLFSFSTWIGHGYDSTNTGMYFAKLIDLQRDIFYAYFFPSFFYSCGLLGGGYVLYFIVSSMKKLPLIFILFVMVCLTNTNIPTQIFWFLIIQMSWVAKSNQFEKRQNMLSCKIELKLPIF